MALGPDGRLCARAAIANRRLQGLIAEALRASADAVSEPLGALTLADSSGRELHVWARPLLCGSAAVFATNPNALPARLENTLRCLYQLTPAEARLAVALAAGESPQAFAARTGVSEETARCHLKRILAKTETHRQADLVRLIVTGPAILIGGADA